MRRKYYNGKVYLGEGRFGTEFAVEGEKFVSPQGAFDELVDLEGQLVLPGFNDSHLHLVQMSQNRHHVQLAQARSIEEVIRSSREHLAAHRPQALYGRGWNHDYFPSGQRRLLNRHDLDQISTEIPVILERVCGHVLATNSRALELLAVQEDTVVPGGEIRREGGVATGIFTENAVAFAKSILPQDSREELKGKILEGMEELLSWGITSVQSCDIYEDNYSFIRPLLEELYGEGRSLPRYHPQVNFQTPEGFLKYWDQYLKEHPPKNLPAGSLKIFKDGSLGARTAQLREDYGDDPGNRGVSALSPQLLHQLFALAQERRVPVLTHAIGDGAVASVMEAIVHFDPENSLGHGIVHCQITGADQLRAIAEHAILTLTQPVFLDYDITIVEERVGRELAKTSYAFKSLNHAPGHLESFGTDAPVEEVNPFANLYHAITRKRKDGSPKRGFHPQEALSLPEALDIYTLGGARVQGQEGQKGRIAPGQWADFLVLGEDIFQQPPEVLLRTRPREVYLGGERVF
ncbi:MAG: amidohydrolase [Tissierellia bacterium]|nr:amidohydrolase [Tissierellia bacterium]